MYIVLLLLIFYFFKKVFPKKSCVHSAWRLKVYWFSFHYYGIQEEFNLRIDQTEDCSTTNCAVVLKVYYTHGACCCIACIRYFPASLYNSFFFFFFFISYRDTRASSLSYHLCMHVFLSLFSFSFFFQKQHAALSVFWTTCIHTWILYAR